MNRANRLGPLDEALIIVSCRLNRCYISGTRNITYPLSFLTKPNTNILINNRAPSDDIIDLARHGCVCVAAEENSM
jgi:hypothetical protein